MSAHRTLTTSVIPSR